MPSSKARQLADLLGGGTEGVASFSGTGAIDIPEGTTAQRPANPDTGYLRFNTTLDQLEQYTTDGWKGISAPPQVSSVDVTTIDTSADSQTFVITGQNFDNAATATLTDANGATLTATSSTRNSSTQMTLVYSGAEYDAITINTPEPLVVKVINGSGIEAKLEGVVGVDDNPIWNSPAANSNNTFVIDGSSSLSLSATDPETNGSITYSVASGTLPTGLSLSGSTISGTAEAGGSSFTASGVSSPITIAATGLDGEVTNRTFNIVRKWKDGSSQAQAAVSAQAIRDLGITTDGTFWIHPTNCPNPFEVHCFNSIESGGWELAYRFGSTTNNTSGDASGSWGVSNWAGWGATNQNTIDNLSGNGDYSVRADNDAMSPSFAYTPFTDWMVISNRTGKTDKRTGHRMGSTMACLNAVTGGTSQQNYTTNVLFGSLQWLQVLDIKSDLATVDAWGGATRVGFKIRSDSSGTTPTDRFTGGMWTANTHYSSQIGIGRESSNDDGNFGGGFGGNYHGGNFYKMHGHWWGHGNQWTYSSPNIGNVFYGHSVYVRRA